MPRATSSPRPDRVPSPTARTTAASHPTARAGARAAASAATASGFASEIVAVTPALAEQWLAATGPNRPVHQLTVDRYAADMQAGRWQLNGDRVRFDADGALRDGRHRLSAVVQSGTTVPMEVARGLSEEAVQTVDTGRGRSFSDALHIENVANARALASVAKWLWRYDTGAMVGRARSPSHAELRETVARYPVVHDAIREVQRSKEFQPHAVIAFVYTLARTHMPRKAMQWLEALQEGENLTRTHPVWHLRRKLGGRQALTTPLRPIEAAALTAKAWNAFAANEAMPSLTWSDIGPKAEPFPTIR